MQFTYDNCTIPGANITTNVEVPPLSRDEIRGLWSNPPEKMTRYFPKAHLLSNQAGFMRFKPLSRIKGYKNSAEGRNSDTTESLRKTFHQSISGSVTGKVGAFQFYNTDMRQSQSGFGPDGIFDPVKREKMQRFQNTAIIHTEVINDYCACFSIGEFSLETLREFRKHEKDEKEKPDAYVTYSTKELLIGIRQFLLNEIHGCTLSLLGRSVVYAEKDMTVIFQSEIPDPPPALVRWLSNAFVKLEKYAYEKEFRLLAVATDRPGSLPKSAEPLLTTSNELIAKSITASGVVPECYL